MIFSAQQIFSDDQVLTATAASTNIIDLGAPGTVLNAPAALVRDIGKGEPIPIVVQLTAAATGTSPTLIATLQTDDNAAFSSAKNVAVSATKAGGAAGDKLTLFYIPEGTNERYMRINYTVGGTTPSFTVTAGIVWAAQTNV